MPSLQAVAAAALADKCISWQARGDIGAGMPRGSVGDSELRTRLAGHSEVRAVASTKAIWWDLHLASLLTHLFVFCLYGYRFLSGEKSYGREILHACWSTIRTGLLPF